ncbi:hypothetical protein [Histophilus somni]|uniref:hypothetical protein n=1 Tax=Histophilus somni TaxID=731 RepID=UPI001E4A5ED5|nr:hypothetical protein [Histophilus somni]
MPFYFFRIYLFLLLKSAVLFGVFLLSACNEKQETIKTENFQHKRSEQIRLQEITKQQLTRGVYADLVIDPLLLAKRRTDRDFA